MWRELMDAPAGFDGSGLVVVGSDHHRAAPAGWTGIVRLGADAVVVTPAAEVDRIRAATRSAAARRQVDPAEIGAMLRPARTLGPALLFYGAPTPTGAAPGAAPPEGDVIGPLDVTDDRVAAVLDDATAHEREESAVDDSTSGVFVARTAGGAPAALCAWRVWPHGIAHMSSLTAASHRRGGFGCAAAAHALTEAVRHGLLPQWRAAAVNEPSIALARRLGLHHLGDQYSVLPS